MGERDGEASAKSPSATIDSFIRDFVAETLLAHESPREDELDKELIGRTIGRYRVLLLLGKGGMGRVYEAEDVELGRRVAMKFLPSSDVARRESLERFSRERSVTAELEHPGIVPIYDSGMWMGCRPYYVMRKVGGAPFDQLLKRAVKLEERLALLDKIIAVADAVGFAHHHGVIHRDLKPANILIGTFGETLVADWGLAKHKRAAESDSGDEVASPTLAGETTFGAIVGTPAYMPPEQARGDMVDERVDVYAIGAMLHELLTGEPPHARGGSDLSMRIVGRIASDNDQTTSALSDLTAIVEKALSPAAAARYGNAAELAEELRRFQTGQLVGARRYTRLDLLKRWAIRYRSMLLLAAAMGAALVVVAAVSVRRIVRERDTANRARLLAETARRESAARNDSFVLLQARAQLQQDPTAALAWLKTYPVSSPNWNTVSEIASDAWSRGIARHVWRAQHPFVARALAVSSDSRLVAAGNKENGVQLCDLQTGHVRWLASDIELGGPVLFSVDDKSIVASDGVDAVRIWDLATGARPTIEKMHAARLQFTSDGRFLVGTGRIEGADVWNVVTGRVRAFRSGDGELTAAAVIPGQHAAAVVVGSSLFVEDLDNGQRRRIGPLRIMPFRGSIAVSPDGRWVAIGAVRAVLLFDLRTREARTLTTAIDATSNVRFTPDGTLFSFGSATGALRWDIERRTARALDTSVEVRSLAWSPRGQMLVGAENGHLSFYERFDEPARSLLGHDGTISALAFSPDGQWAISSSTDRTVRAWRIGEGDVQVVHGAGSPHLSDDGRLLLVARPGDWAAKIVDLGAETSQLLTGARPFAWSDNGAISPNGGEVVFSDVGRTVSIFDRVAGQRRTLIQYGPAHTLDLAEAFSPDGRRVAIVLTSGAVIVVNVATGEQKLVGRHDAEPSSVAFSPNGRTLLTSARDRTVRLWDVEGANPPRVLRGHAAEVFDAKFSRDGRRVVSSSADGTVRIWDVDGRQLNVLRGHGGRVSSADFSPDGATVISGSADRTVRLWDLATGESRVVGRADAAIWAVKFLPDGRSFLRSGAEGVVRISEISATPGFTKDPTRLRTWLDGETTARVDASGVLASRRDP